MTFPYYNDFDFLIRNASFEVRPMGDTGHGTCVEGEKFLFNIDGYVTCGVFVSIVDEKLIIVKNICNIGKQESMVKSLRRDIELEKEKYFNLIKSALTIEKFKL